VKLQKVIWDAIVDYGSLGCLEENPASGKTWSADMSFVLAEGEWICDSLVCVIVCVLTCLSVRYPVPKQNGK
jgi:hypothetical protein